MRVLTAQGIERQLEFFKQWPDNQKYWLKPDGSTYKPGETIKLPTLAKTLKRMVEAERKNLAQAYRLRQLLPADVPR